MNYQRWLRGFSVYAALVCGWHAYVTYAGSPSPFEMLLGGATRRNGGGGIYGGVYHK